MNRTRKKNTLKMKHATMRSKTGNKRNKAMRRIKTCKGGASSFTVKFPNKSIYQVVVEKNHSIVTTNVAKENAIKLIDAAIPKEYLRNKSFQYGRLSLKDFLKRSIVSIWNKMPHQISFDMLLRSARSTCTQEVIISVLGDISLKIHSNTNTVPINENELSKQNHEYDQYIPFIEHELSNEDKVLDPFNSQFIPKLKRMKFVEIAYLLATGFMNALAKTWVEPENWMEKHIRPTIKVGVLDRFLCKKTDAEKTGMSFEEKQQYANSILNELLGK